MDDKKFITIHTSILKSTPVISFPISVHEPLYPQVIEHMIRGTKNESEREILKTKGITLRLGDLNINQNKFPSGYNKGGKYPSLHDISNHCSDYTTLMAENDNEDFYDHFHVVRMHTPTPKDVDEFHRWVKVQEKSGNFYDIWHPPVAGKYADVRLKSHHKPSDTYLEVTQSSNSLKHAIMKSRESIGPDFFHSFKNSHEITQYMKELTMKLNKINGLYKAKAQMFSPGNTTYGEKIMGIRVSFDNNLEKRKFLLIGGIHSREWVGVTTPLYILQNLYLPNSKKERNANHALLSDVEMIIIPLVNVDGYNFTWTRGNRLWRKNCNNRYPHAYDVGGVDINRNFDSHWNLVGTSKNPSSEIYSGISPSSETETVVLQNFIAQNAPFVGMIDFHCYMRALSFPYSYTKIKHSNYNNLYKCASHITDAITSHHGTNYKFSQISLGIYQCSGTLLDWVLENNYCYYPFVNELDGDSSFFHPNAGFLTPPEKIEPIGMENYLGVKVMIKYTRKIRNHEIKLKSHSLPKNISLKTLRHVPRGLANYGNTCYVNSVLQCFGSLRPLCDYLNKRNLLHLYDIKTNDNNGQTLSSCFINAISQFWTVGSVDSKKIMSNLLKSLYSKDSKSNSPQIFTRYTQEDASEFALKCLKSIMSNHSSLYNKLFTSSTLNSHSFLEINSSLPSKIDLESLLSDHFNSNRDIARNKNSGNVLPEVLMFTLGRAPGLCPSKLLSIPLYSLNLKPFLPSLRRKEDIFYDLNAFVSFKGSSMYSGHYVATIKSGSEWLTISDESIRPMNIVAGERRIKSSDAYLLFFSRNRSLHTVNPMSNNDRMIYY